MIGTLGRVRVTTAGTPVQLTTTRTPVQGLYVTPEHDNTGVVYVGLAGMVAATGVNVIGVIGIPGTHGIVPFNPQVSASPVIGDLSLLWIDASVSGDGIFVGYVAQ